MDKVLLEQWQQLLAQQERLQQQQQQQIHLQQRILWEEITSMGRSMAHVQETLGATMGHVQASWQDAVEQQRWVTCRLHSLCLVLQIWEIQQQQRPYELMETQVRELQQQLQEVQLQLEEDVASKRQVRELQQQLQEVKLQLQEEDVADKGFDVSDVATAAEGQKDDKQEESFAPAPAANESPKIPRIKVRGDRNRQKIVRRLRLQEQDQDHAKEQEHAASEMQEQEHAATEMLQHVLPS